MYRSIVLSPPTYTSFQMLVYSNVFSPSSGWLQSSIMLTAARSVRACSPLMTSTSSDVGLRSTDDCIELPVPSIQAIICSVLIDKTAHNPTRCSQSSSKDYPTEGLCWASVASVQYIVVEISHSGKNARAISWRMKNQISSLLVYSACSPCFPYCL